MITNLGKDAIKNYFGGVVGSYAGSIALGVGSAAATVNDVRLSCEVVRLPLTTKAADLSNGRVVFKATLPAGGVGTIYEIGLYEEGLVSPDLAMSTIQQIVNWTNGTYVTGHSRVGSSTVQIAAATNTTTTATVAHPTVDASGYESGSVVFIFTSDANLGSVKFRIGSSSTNYREYTVIITAGYNIVRVSTTSGTQTGTVDWTSISYLAAIVTATTGGATNLYLDGIHMEPQSNNDNLVARYVLTTPQVVDTASASEVEFSLAVSV